MRLMPALPESIFDVCYHGCDDRDPLAVLRKAGSTAQINVARGHAELSVLSARRAVGTGDPADRYADAPENLYVHLDDRHVPKIRPQLNNH